MIGKEMKVNIATIVASIGRERYNNSFLEGWDHLYTHKGTMERVLHDTNFSRDLLGKEVVYCQMTPYVKVLQSFA